MKKYRKKYWNDETISPLYNVWGHRGLWFVAGEAFSGQWLRSYKYFWLSWVWNVIRRIKLAFFGTQACLFTTAESYQKWILQRGHQKEEMDNRSPISHLALLHLSEKRLRNGAHWVKDNNLSRHADNAFHHKAHFVTGTWCTSAGIILILEHKL